MIFSLVFVTILYTVLSQSINPFRASERELKLNFQRNNKLLDDKSIGEDIIEAVGKLEDHPWDNKFQKPRLLQKTIYTDVGGDDNSVEANDSIEDDSEEDYLLHMSANKDLIKFLKWTMGHLSPMNNNNASVNFYPALNKLRKFQLSGRREMPFYVEEPRYIVVRREPDEVRTALGINPEMPFIPPRGRKYIPNMEALMRRTDLFIPHRGKKDRIKDIFKYDDLFFPNRGKKHYPNRKKPSSYRYNYQWLASRRKGLHLPFGICFTHCDDIKSQRMSPSESLSSSTVAESHENINDILSSSVLHPPPPLLQALLPIGQQDDETCLSLDKTAAECQNENKLIVNGFDQSIKTQIYQQQQQQFPASKGTSKDQHKQLPSSSAYEEEGGRTSSFWPLTRTDQVRRLQLLPIIVQQRRHF